MSWNRSDKHPTICCPECGAPGIDARGYVWEWICYACESTGPGIW